MDGLEGKVVVVAGGGGGTGRATARLLGASGASVVVGDVVADRAEEVAAAIRADGGRALAVAFDMGDPASTTALIGRAVEHFGRLDGLHNVAGNPSAHRHDGDVVSTPDETWDLQLRSHLLAYAHACRTAIPLLLDAGGGAIVNTSSNAARGAGTTRIAYQAAKAGVETLTRHVAATWGKRGIRCNALSYGVVLTDNARAQLSAEFLAAALAQTWSPRLGEPDDVAGLAALLFSDRGAWVNGQVIDVNGGMLLTG